MRSTFALLAVFTLMACVSRSPFTTPPYVIAVAEPCRFMGTVHKESRQRLEVLRACGAISMKEWSCMATELKAVDVEFTAACRSRSVAYPEIAARQRALYSACAGWPKPEIVECMLLSEDAICLDAYCE